MTCKINADTTDGLKIVSDTSGAVDVQSNGTTIAEVSSGGLAVTVAGSGVTDALKLKTTATNTVPAILFSGDISDSQVDLSKIRCQQDSSTVSGLVFETKTGGTIAEKVRITGAGKVGIGIASPTGKLAVSDGTTTLELNPTSGLGFMGTRSNHPIVMQVNASEKMRIDTNGIAMFRTTDSDPWNNGAGTAGGAAIGASNIVGLGAFARVQGDPIAVNYIDGSNGNLIVFYHNGSQIGSISFSGTTVSYNAFTGSHPSRLTDNSDPAILKGTVMETLDDMCDWYDLHYTGVDGEGNDVAKVKEIALPDGKSAGDSYTMDINGVSRTGTIVAKGNEKHMQCKVSDTEDSTRIYGVFSDYLNGDSTVYNDMNINAVGTSVIRVASGVTVSAGDLLSSKGDGTAKLQGDDIIRTKTIGKVLSNVKQEIYDDGSFTIPSALYCG